MTLLESILLQVHMPKTGQGQSLVEFLKRGPLGPEDVKAVARAMRAANTVQSADAGLQVRCGGMCCSHHVAQRLISQCWALQCEVTSVDRALGRPGHLRPSLRELCRTWRACFQVRPATRPL